MLCEGRIEVEKEYGIKWAASANMYLDAVEYDTYVCTGPGLVIRN